MFALLLFLYLFFRNSTTALPGLMLPVAHNTQCESFVPRTDIVPSASLMHSGAFCLRENAFQHYSSFAGHSWPPYDHSLVNIRGGDINIDLQGNALMADSRSHGLRSYAAINRGWAEREGRTFGANTHGVVIKNGFIDLRSVGTGILLAEGSGYRTPVEELDRSSPLQPTHHVLENLVIRTKGIGVVLEGEGNVIRNCIIESEGDAALILVGPNNVVENNRIILKDRIIPADAPFRVLESGWIKQISKILESRRSTRAALVLRKSSGSRVAGNTIEVEGASETRHAVYVRDDSRNVILQNNRVIGPRQPAKTDDGVTLIVRDNQLVSR